MAETTGAADLANTLLDTLTEGVDFSLPDIDLDDPLYNIPDAPIPGSITPITIAQLTTGQVDGDGVFDKLMTSLVAHLKVEFDNNRISGAEYTKAYVGIIGHALQTSSTFLLTKDQAYWQSILAQQQAYVAQVQVVTSRVELATAKAMLFRTQYEALTAEANYSLTKIKLSTEDATYGNLVLQGAGLDFTNTNILPAQENLLTEQGEVQRAQTLNTRSDGATITGVLGKQKDLYTQQIDSYKRDSEQKFVKMYADVWTAMKTIDEGITPPSQFTNEFINTLLTKMRANLAMT